MEVKLENSSEELMSSLPGRRDYFWILNTIFGALSFLSFIQLKPSKLQLPLLVMLMGFSLGNEDDCKERSANKWYSA